jgi:hypothetical protein
MRSAFIRNSIFGKELSKLHFRHFSLSGVNITFFALKYVDLNHFILKMSHTNTIYWRRRWCAFKYFTFYLNININLCNYYIIYASPVINTCTICSNIKNVRISPNGVLIFSIIFVINLSLFPLYTSVQYQLVFFIIESVCLLCQVRTWSLYVMLMCSNLRSV